jgi:(2R)-ethylmalonyl-CoA mutase
MRTYSGHSSPEASNALYRHNLAKGQTGLSVAFDLPTQMGLDPDHPLAAGEVGRVGVPIASIADMRALFEGIPIERANTSMTINATAPWLLALYVAVAEERGIDPHKLAGTTQNDLAKEYLARGTYIFPPEPSLKLSADVVTYAVEHIPSWNPMNVCSYHLQEAGARPDQEVAYALGAAVAMLDCIKNEPSFSRAASIPFSNVFGRLSFFVNAGVRFVEEMCKLRAMATLWERIGRERYGITDAKMLRFRYGVQVNSLSLTEQQPENNIVRVVLEMLGVTLSKRARARAVQLPAWNEALGLPRPWDQQWSLRAQQILAYESDLLEYGDLFDGSLVVAERSRSIEEAAWDELGRVLAMGGIVRAIESGYVKERLVAANAERVAAIERGERTVVGVNRFAESEPSPLTGDGGRAILTVDDRAEARQIARVEKLRKTRDAARAQRAIDAICRAAERGESLLPASIDAAHANVTTGEWGAALRKVFGEYRAPTGVTLATATPLRGPELDALRADVAALGEAIGRRPKILVGKPGLDGHSNGAEQIALRARDAGFEVVYEGIRLTPAQIVRSACDEGVHVVGLSILSGAHAELVRAVLERLRAHGQAALPVVVGGIIPEADARALLASGVARVYTPKDYAILPMLRDMLDLVRRTHASERS